MSTGEQTLAPAIARERARCVILSRYHLVIRDLALVLDLVDSGASVDVAFQRFWNVANAKQREELLIARAELTDDSAVS